MIIHTTPQTIERVLAHYVSRIPTHTFEPVSRRRVTGWIAGRAGLTPIWAGVAGPDDLFNHYINRGYNVLLPDGNMPFARCAYALQL